MRKRLTALLSSSFIILLTVIIVTAQAGCDALLEEAIFAVEDNCDATGRNEACYGFDQVSASFVTDVADDFFSQPADLSSVADIETIATAPLNLETGAWGVALMNVQANLPNTLPGQNVTFFLLGDTEVENAVSEDEAFAGSEGIDITVQAPNGANIRSGPGLNFNVVTGADNGDTLTADGVSEDGEWLRVIALNRPLWISRSVIDDTAEGIDALPTLTADLNSPMQAFYLRSGIGQPECVDFPDNTLIVQGPESIEVNITVNGADVTIGSTVGLRVISIEGEFFLEAIAFAGEIDFMGQTLQPGERSLACLGDSDDRGLDGEDNDLIVTCDPTEPELVDDFNAEWCVLDELPSSLLNYGLSIGCESAPAVTTTDNAGTGNNPDVGDGSLVDSVNCSTFSLVSPLAPTNSGTQSFIWNTALGNNITYQLVFYNFEGTEVESFFTLPISTPDASELASLSVNLGAQTSTGGQFSWEVRAYVDGVYACASGGSGTLVRTGELNPPPPAPPEAPPVTTSIGVSLSCGVTIGEYFLNYTSADVGTTDFTVTYTDGLATIQTFTVSPPGALPDGNTFFFEFQGPITNFTATANPSGVSGFFAGPITC
ncbi:MAG: SH3 domain-containing protein [Chloroflexota bacterium]